MRHHGLLGKVLLSQARQCSILFVHCFPFHPRPAKNPSSSYVLAVVAEQPNTIAYVFPFRLLATFNYFPRHIRQTFSAPQLSPLHLNTCIFILALELTLRILF